MPRTKRRSVRPGKGSRLRISENFQEMTFRMVGTPGGERHRRPGRIPKLNYDRLWFGELDGYRVRNLETENTRCQETENARYQEADDGLVSGVRYNRVRPVSGSR